MKRIKNLLVKMMALALACLMLAGCGATGVQETTETPKNEVADTANTTTEAAKETETIVWYVFNGNNNADMDKVEAAINEYIEPLIGVKVSILTSNEEPELALALAAGEEIDLFWTAFWANGNNYIAENSCLDLTDYLQNYPDLYNSIPENVWTAAQKDGRNWFVPVYKEAASGRSYMYSKNIADKYGWDLSNVKSFEDLTPYLEEMKQNGAKCAFMPNAEAWPVVALDTYEPCVSAVVGIRRSDGKVLNLMETEEYKEFVELMYSWNQAGYIAAESVDRTNYSDNQKTLTELLASEDTAFVFWSNTPDGDANASIRYGTPMATLMTSQNYLSFHGTFGSAYMVNAKTEKADACLKFLGLLYTDQTVADLICYGIEGTHYTRDAEGYVTIIPDSGYASSGVWATCSVMSASLQAGESADKKAQYSEFNSNALVTPESSFIFDQTNVAAEVASVDAVYVEYRYLLDAGFYDPDVYLPKFQAALKEAGVDAVVAELQAQYDAYLANQK